jgi:hypothetical protein
MGMGKGAGGGSNQAGGMQLRLKQNVKTAFLAQWRPF